MHLWSIFIFFINRWRKNIWQTKQNPTPHHLSPTHLPCVPPTLLFTSSILSVHSGLFPNYNLPVLAFSSTWSSLFYIFAWLNLYFFSSLLNSYLLLCCSLATISNKVFPRYHPSGSPKLYFPALLVLFFPLTQHVPVSNTLCNIVVFYFHLVFSDVFPQWNLIFTYSGNTTKIHWRKDIPSA